jgi:hypothetical protein
LADTITSRSRGNKYTKPSSIYVPVLAEHLAKHFDDALRRREAVEEQEAGVLGLESVLANDLRRMACADVMVVENSLSYQHPRVACLCLPSEKLA